MLQPLPGPDKDVQHFRGCSSSDKAPEPMGPKPAGSVPPSPLKSQPRVDGMRQLLGNKYYSCKEHDSNNTKKPPGTEDFLGTGSSLQAPRAEGEDLLTHTSKGY